MDRDAFDIRRSTAIPAAKASPEPAVTARRLAPDTDSGRIAARSADACPRGVVAMPALVIAKPHAPSGAQLVRLWHQVIGDITEKTGR